MALCSFSSKVTLLILVGDKAKILEVAKQENISGAVIIFTQKDRIKLIEVVFSGKRFSYLNDYLKQNAQILLEVSQNYEKILEKKSLGREDKEKTDMQINNFKGQFLYLLTAINKLVQQEKNAK